MAAAADGLAVARRAAAHAAVDQFVTGSCCVGVGSGSTVVDAVQRMDELARVNGWQLKCVPTSFQSRQLITQSTSLILQTLEEIPTLDVTIDGADEVDAGLVLIKGGGGCHLQEKVVAAASEKLIIIADYRKQSPTLGTSWKKGVPLEVVPFAYSLVKKSVEQKLGGKAVLRLAVNKAGPVVTDNGNFILDWQFSSADLTQSWCEINDILLRIPGLLETGLFINMADVAIFGQADGKVVQLTSGCK